MTIRERFGRWWQQRRTPPSFDAGQISEDGSALFADGVPYHQPPVVPYFVPRDTESVRHFLEHSSYNQNWRDTYRFQFDANRGMGDGPVGMPADDPLMEWDYATRLDVWTNCHAAYHRNPLARHGVNLTGWFVVGKGHTVTAMNDEVQQVIDDFRRNPENFVFGYDRAFVKDLQVDGEIFVRFFQEDGKTIITQVPPWHVRDIKTQKGFFRRVVSYELEYQQGSEQITESVKAEEMLHIAINAHGYELRGRPDLFVILPWLRAYNEWLVDRARQNKWRNALLWLVKVASRVPGAVAKVRAVWRTPPTPGSVAVVPENVDVSALSNPVGAGDAAEDGRQIKLNSIVGLGLPEYMMADGENANLASATAQQLPALWKFTDFQELLAEQVWTPIYRRVIQGAIDAGTLDEEVIITDEDGDPVPDTNGQDQTIPALEAVTVTYYELQSDNPKSLAEAWSLNVNSGIASMETAREKQGLDHWKEEKRLQREEAMNRDKVAQGLRAPEPEDEIPGEAPDDDEAEMRRNGAQPEARPAQR